MLRIFSLSDQSTILHNALQTSSKIRSFLQHPVQEANCAPRDPDNIPSTSSGVSPGSFQQAFANAIASGSSTGPAQCLKSGVVEAIDIEELLDGGIDAGKHHKESRLVVKKSSLFQVKNMGTLFGNARQGTLNVSLVVEGKVG